MGRETPAWKRRLRRFHPQTLPYVPPLQPPPAGAERAIVPQRPAALITDPILDMKVLVIYRTGNVDGVYATVTAYLDILGIPYDEIDTTQTAPAGTIEAGDLWDGANHGYYYAIFLTTDTVWQNLSVDERALLQGYERDFNVRQAIWYAWPSPLDNGLTYVRTVMGNNDTLWCPGTPEGVPFDATLSTAGQTVFPYLKTGVVMTIDGNCLWGYLAVPAVGADVTPLVVDGEGNTFLAVYRPGDGRELMTMTMGSFYPALPPQYIHARALPYGIINWATRGLFLGERHLYFSPQPDDMLCWGDSWGSETHTYTLDIGYRNAPSDLQNLVDWMDEFRTTVPNAAGFRLELPFNGDGSEDDRYENGNVIPGTLTAKAMELQGAFTWLNHTYSHRDLDIDEVPYPGYALSTYELETNSQTAAFLGFSDYSLTTLLTGDYSGINPPNPDLADAAYDQGVRYMEVNASLTGYSNPTPNTGIPHPTRPEILQIPRYANNIFYAPTNPAEETDLYNWIYCDGYALDPENTPPCFDFDYVLNNITDQALGFMLDFSVNPTMFHMNNLDDYGDGNTLMTDFIESLYGKYNALYNDDTPILSLRTQEIGEVMRDRMAYNASGVTAQIACGNEITVNTTQAATIPLTGVDYGEAVETYSGQTISYLALADNDTLVIPGDPASTPAAISDLAITRSGSDIVLTWSPTTVDTEGEPLAAIGLPRVRPRQRSLLRPYLRRPDRRSHQPHLHPPARRRGRGQQLHLRRDRGRR